MRREYEQVTQGSKELTCYISRYNLKGLSGILGKSDFSVTFGNSSILTYADFSQWNENLELELIYRCLPAWNRFEQEQNTLSFSISVAQIH